MAMEKCRECGAEVSDQAKTCPKCGVSTPVRKTSKLTWLATLVIVPVVALAVFRSGQPPPDTAVAKSASSQGPEERRRSAVYDILRAVKRRLRNPESVAWEAVFSNEDASTVCVQYRAQNGFGGMARERIVIVGNKATQSDKLWASKCAGLPFSLAAEAQSWTSL